MDNYTKAILALMKEKYIEIVGERQFQDTSEARSYYVQHLDDNLYRPMSGAVLKEYRNGSGNEIDSGKMCALRSSSALTYNLFWNKSAEFRKSDCDPFRIGAGNYSVEFEKQYHTLKPTVSNRPANLDAFLYCTETKEAIACEMKMTEWIFNHPGALRDKYLDPDNYITESAGKVFVAVAKELIGCSDYEEPDVIKSEYPCQMRRYDAFQMFKHAVACFTACMTEEPREIKKLTLVNCVWTLPTPEKLKPEHCSRYLQQERNEQDEFSDFKQIMLPIKALFASINVEFEISFFTFTDFLHLIEKEESELQYLRRYTFH